MCCGGRAEQRARMLEELCCCEKDSRISPPISLRIWGGRELITSQVTHLPNCTQEWE